MTNKRIKIKNFALKSILVIILFQYVIWCFAKKSYPENKALSSREHGKDHKKKKSTEKSTNKRILHSNSADSSQQKETMLRSKRHEPKSTVSNKKTAENFERPKKNLAKPASADKNKNPPFHTNSQSQRKKIDSDTGARPTQTCKSSNKVLKHSKRKIPDKSVRRKQEAHITKNTKQQDDAQEISPAECFELDASSSDSPFSKGISLQGENTDPWELSELEESKVTDKSHRHTPARPHSYSERFHESLLRAKEYSVAALREVKGLVSSELEAVLLKATRPSDYSVKPKHLEALLYCVRSTPYDYDVYTPILKKLWTKMHEPDWRTVIKSFYILHKFSVDGPLNHAVSLKTRPKELSQVFNPKLKDNYFNLNQLMRVVFTESGPDIEFTKKYAAYVMHRCSCFSPGYPELDLKNAKKDEVLADVMLLTTSALLIIPDKISQSLVIASCAEQVSQDIYEIFSKLAEQISNAYLQNGNEINQDWFQNRVNFYLASASDVEKYLQRIASLIAKEEREVLFKTSLKQIPDRKPAAELPTELTNLEK